jgi:TRAP-type mannitol/chloroaromatic compound transport system substrate-binding protein
VERRRFIVTAGGTLAVAGVAVVVEAPHVIAQPKVQWRMSTTWSPANDVLQGSAQQLGRLVDGRPLGPRRRRRIPPVRGGVMHSTPPLA